MERHQDLVSCVGVDKNKCVYMCCLCELIYVNCCIFRLGISRTIHCTNVNAGKYLDTHRVYKSYLHTLRFDAGTTVDAQHLKCL